MAEYHPISAKDQSGLHQFGKKVLPEIVTGYVLHAEGIWKGDILVADMEELEKMDASELHARRLNAKKVLTLPKMVIFYIPDHKMEQSNYLEEFRFWEHPPWSGTNQTEEKNKDIFWETQTGLHHHFKTHRRMMVKQGTISGPFQETTFTVITLNRESNCTCRENSHSQFHFDILTWLEQQVRPCMSSRKNAYRRGPRFIRLVDRIHTIHHIGRKTSRWVYMVREAGGKEANNVQAWLLVARNMERHLSSSATKRKTKVGYRKTEAYNARRLRGIYFIDPANAEFKRKMKNVRRKLEIPMPAAVLCKIRWRKYNENCRTPDTRKTKKRMHRWSRRIYETAFGRNST